MVIPGRMLKSGRPLLAVVLLASSALAQEYSSGGSGTSVPDPYAPQAAPAYPAASYGATGGTQAGTNAAAYGTQPAQVASTDAGYATGTAPAAAGQGQNLGSLFLQIQQLREEMMRLNGRLEEQAHELRQLREQSLERYMELDRRLSSGAADGSAAGEAPVAGGEPAAAPVMAPVQTGGTAAPAQPGEAEAYRAAYSLVQAQRFDEAVKAFQKFQRDYPGGHYAPNAYYWLGELYLVVQPPDLESSRQAFMMLLTQYPDNSKAPDALYKLGKVQFMKGNREKAREYFDQVIARYGSTNSSAVKLARDFLAENY